jgi:hypothetical protein
MDGLIWCATGIVKDLTQGKGRTQPKDPDRNQGGRYHSLYRFHFVLQRAPGKVGTPQAV